MAEYSDFYTCNELDVKDRSTSRSYRITAQIHGTKNNVSGAEPVPHTHCGSWPGIYLKFDVTCTRAIGSTTVTFSFTNCTWELGGNGSAYGFAIQGSVGVSDDTHPESTEFGVLKKENGRQYNWTGAEYVKVKPSFTLTLNDVTTDEVLINIYGGCPSGWTSDWYEYACYNGRYISPSETNFCYGSRTTSHLFLYNISVSIPKLVSNHTLTFNKNAESAYGPKPTSQTVSATDSTKIYSEVSYPFAIKYKYGNSDLATDNVQRNHTEWFENSAGTGTQHPNNSYIGPQTTDITYYAKWGIVPFTTRTFNRVATIKFNTNGGESCADRLVTPGRPCTGYSTTNGGAKLYNANVAVTNYNPSTSTTSYTLYAIYGSTTYPANSLPTPNRAGYEFEGWYYDSACTSKVGSSVLIDKDTVTLYAKWIEMPVKKFTSSWNPVDKYVWRMTTSGWKKEAPIYKATSSNSWTKILG